MAVRFGQTRQAAPRLLKTVGGKPHARNEDHEQVQRKDGAAQEGLSLAEQEQMGLFPIDAEPLSSSDEASRQPTPKSKPNDQDTLKKPPGSTRKRKADLPLAPREPEPGLRKPGAKKTRNAAPRPPKVGLFEQSRAAKEGRELDKENALAKNAPPRSSENGSLGSLESDWGFDPLLSQSSQKGRKVQFGGKTKTPNIHAAPARKKTSKPASRVSGFNTKGGGRESDTSSLSEPTDDGEPSNLAWREGELKGESAELKDPELRKVPTKKKKPACVTMENESLGMNDAELNTMLKPTLREQLGLTDASDSSLPPSSAPQEDMDNLDSYVRELPAEAEEGTTCPLCTEPVDEDSYWEFWKGRNKTVKNQATFCHIHRKKTVQEEYLAEGYPAVDGLPSIQWSALTERIKKYRMTLYNILTGEIASTYRTRYEPLALTGKAAAVPSKRADLSPSKQQQLESYALDDNAVYPGYYGPHGRRLITESVMSLLHTEIKRSTDPVVQTSGPATFVQAVLVPEVSVRLIMEDLKVDWEAAEEVRERTFEMGVLLNEEIEDEVVVDEEEGENEYHH